MLMKILISKLNLLRIFVCICILTSQYTNAQQIESEKVTNIFNNLQKDISSSNNFEAGVNNIRLSRENNISEFVIGYKHNTPQGMFNVVSRKEAERLSKASAQFYAFKNDDTFEVLDEFPGVDKEQIRLFAQDLDEFKKKKNSNKITGYKTLDDYIYDYFHKKPFLQEKYKFIYEWRGKENGIQNSLSPLQF